MSPLEPKTAKLYLLGRLDQTSLTQIEQELLTSATLYDEILLAEDELTDQYFANELSEEERRSFETHFLSTPERLQKLRFARTFRRYVGEAALQDATPQSVEPTPTPFKPLAKKPGLLSFLPIQNPVAAYALAAAVVIAFIGISWIAFNSLKRTPRGSGNLLIVSLTPGLTRENGETKSFAIAADTESVQLNLELTANEFPGYEAELLTSERESLLVKAGLRPESVEGKRSVKFTIPAELLKRNDYRVRLSGRTAAGTYEPLSSYSFRVTDNR